MISYNESARPDQVLRQSKANSTKLRMMRLRHWESAVRYVVGFDLEQTGWIGDLVLPQMYARILAEQAQLDGTLGLDDKADRIASVFDLSTDDSAFLWGEAIDLAQANEREVRAAADKRLTETRVASLGHRPMVDSKELAAALRLTRARKQVIFPVPRELVDGKYVFGKRPKTMLPDWIPPMPARVVDRADTAQATRTVVWTLTLEQRHALRDRLGYKMDTISLKQRTLTEAEFRAWTEKRETRTWPIERLEGRKQPGESDYHATRRLEKIGPRTRVREDGITAVRRTYATIIGRSMRTVMTRTKGMTKGQIQALIDEANVTLLHQYGCHTCTDKTGKNTPFQVNLPQIPVVQETEKKAAASGVLDGDEIELSEVDLMILRGWYKGDVEIGLLKPATIRKWRQRKILKSVLYTACEAVLRSKADYGPEMVSNARMRVEMFKDERDRPAALKRKWKTWEKMRTLRLAR